MWLHLTNNYNIKQMNTSMSHILVPVDYSDKAVFGLEMANVLIKKYGGKVTVINVLKGVDPIWSDFFTDDERDRLLEKLKKHLENFSRKYLIDQNTEIDFVIGRGRLCDTILQMVDERNVTSIVMGTSTVDNIKKRIIGTNALRVVTEAKCPVITIKEHPKSNNVERIILPLDLTKETREKTVDAVALAIKFNAAIHVVSAQTFTDDSIHKRLELQLNQVVRFIEKHNVPCTGEILKVNDRVDGVLNFIDEKKGDLIVITTHQQLEFVNSYMGSFAKSIIRSANIPVMSIVPKIKHHVVFSMPAT